MLEHCRGLAALFDEIAGESSRRPQIVVRQFADIQRRIMLGGIKMVGASVIVHEYGLVTAHGPVGTETAEIRELPCRRIAHSHSGTCLAVVGTVHMHPHHELAGLPVINDLRPFQYIARSQIMFPVIAHGRQDYALELPVHKILRRIAADSRHIRTVTFPRGPFRQDGRPFLVFSVPVICPFVIQYAASVGVYRIAVGIVPHSAGDDFRIRRPLLRQWLRLHSHGSLKSHDRQCSHNKKVVCPHLFFHQVSKVLQSIFLSKLLFGNCFAIFSKQFLNSFLFHVSEESVIFAPLKFEKIKLTGTC